MPTDLAKLRNDCHHTFNGGWHDNPEALKAFHHGMDTVFNVIQGKVLVIDALTDEQWLKRELATRLIELGYAADPRFETKTVTVAEAARGPNRAFQGGVRPLTDTEADAIVAEHRATLRRLAEGK